MANLKVSDAQKTLLRVLLFNEHEKWDETLKQRRNSLNRAINNGESEHFINDLKSFVRYAEDYIKDLDDLMSQLNN